MESYHEPNYYGANLVSSCLLQGPGWLDVQKQGLYNLFSRGLVLVWVTSVLLDYLSFFFSFIMLH